MLTVLEEESMAGMAGDRHGLAWSSSWRLGSTSSRQEKLMVLLRLIGVRTSRSPQVLCMLQQPRGRVIHLLYRERRAIQSVANS